MIASKIISLGTGFGCAVVAHSFSNTLQAKEMIDCHDCCMKRLPKARELSLYEKKDDNLIVERNEQFKMPLRSEIFTIRLQLSGIVSYLSAFKAEAVHIYETGVAHTQSTYDYIMNEENKISRTIAIVSGGLFGIVLARKGGYFKKICYGSAGTGLVYSLFYPTTAKEHIYTGLEFTKHHTGNILEKYGGYDTQKIADEANAKVEYVKNTLKIDGLSNQLKDWFDKNKETVSKTINNVSGTKLKDKDNEPDKVSN